MANNLDVKYEVEAMITPQGIIRPLHFKLYQRLFQKFVDKEILVTVQLLRRRRSDRQNRYYYGVIVPCVQAFHKENTGEFLAPEEVHIFNLTTVIGIKPTIKTIMGTEVITMDYKSSSKMDTKEFTEFIESIRSFWAEKGLDIPEPNGENLLTDFIKDE